MQSNSSWAMPRNRTWNWSTGYSDRAGRGSVAPRSNAPALGDVVVAICFLAIVGLVVFGSLLMLFSRVTESLPPAALATCQRLEGCGVPAPAEDSLSWSTPARVDEPTPTP